MKDFKKRIKRHGFTTLELMVVIATIAILASLLIPTFGKVKRSMYMNQSRIQLSRYVFGLNSYYREYGYFPQIISEGASLATEMVLTLDATSSANLIRALSGKETDGASILSAEHVPLNPSGRDFIEFSDDDFYKNTDGTIDRGMLADRFNNKDIHFVIEDRSDTDAVILRDVFSTYPSIQEKISPSGLRERTAFFTVGDNKQSLDVVSWSSGN
jgi:type II secretory pathway pseudopilin PulG